MFESVLMTKLIGITIVLMCLCLWVVIFVVIGKLICDVWEDMTGVYIPHAISRKYNEIKDRKKN